MAGSQLAGMSENDESQRLRGADVQRTTLQEYLRYCHQHLFKSLQISHDLLSTKSSDSTTSVDAKYYPLKLSSVLGHKLSTGHDRDNDRSDEKVAKALAQIFHYMVCCRSTFGYLTGGHSLIFLRIDQDAQVLYHHMVQPDKDAEGEATDLFFTGVAQLSAFCLKSFLEPRKTKEWLLREQARLQTWPNPYPEMREPTAEVPSSSPKAPSTASYVASSPSPKNDPSQSPPVRLTRSSCMDIELVEVGSGPGDTDSDEDHHNDDAGFQTSIPEAVSGSKKKNEEDLGK